MTTAGQYKELPLTEIHESKHNPRRHFNEDTLAELVESIRKVGVITPALVRPRPAGGYELAAGHRRYRASKAAGQPTLPCIVREMDDQAFMEVLTIENLQREDVHPLDEAKGYEALMAAPYKMDVEKIAQRIGKSVKYIYDRVKLLALCKEAQDLFWSGQIEAGHAILLARLSQADQARVIGDEQADYRNGGLFKLEHLLYDEESKKSDRQPIKAASVRELADYIKRNVRFNAQAVDAFLYPQTAEQLAQADKGKLKVIEITYDYLASEEVRSANRSKRVYGERAWKRADGRDGSKTCDRSVMGVITAGAGQGEAFLVCTNKEKCQIHWGAEIKAREKRQKAVATGGETAKKAQDDYRKEQEAQQLEWKKEREQRERWQRAAPKITAAVIEKVVKMPGKADGFLAGLVINAMTNDGRVKVPGMSRGKTVEDLLCYLGAAELVKKINDWDACEKFPKVAKQLGVDLSKILGDKPAKSETVQTAAKKAAKKTKAA